MSIQYIGWVDLDRNDVGYYSHWLCVCAMSRWKEKGEKENARQITAIARASDELSKSEMEMDGAQCFTMTNGERRAARKYRKFFFSFFSFEWNIYSMSIEHDMS